MRKFLSALIVAAATAVSVPASAADIYEDVGVIIGVRGYATGLMTYCFDKIAQSAVYTDARQTWLTNNRDEVTALEAAIVKLGGIGPADQQMIDKAISDKITADVAGQADAAGYCNLFAEAINSGSRDVKALGVAQDAIGRIREMLNAP